MGTQSEDTAPEAERILAELLQTASSTRLLGRARSLSQSMIQAAREHIRRRYPGISEEELALKLIERFYGKEVANRVRAEMERRRGSGSQIP